MKWIIDEEFLEKITKVTKKLLNESGSTGSHFADLMRLKIHEEAAELTRADWPALKEETADVILIAIAFAQIEMASNREICEALEKKLDKLMKKHGVES